MSHVRFPDFSAPAPIARPRPIVVLEPAPVAAVGMLDRVGELVAALVIIAGGAVLVALCTLA